MSESKLYSFNTGAAVTGANDLEAANEVGRFARLLYEECETQAYEDACTLKRQNLGVNVERQVAVLKQHYIDSLLAEKFVRAVCEGNHAARLLVTKLSEEAGYSRTAPDTAPGDTQQNQAVRPHLTLVR